MQTNKKETFLAFYLSFFLFLLGPIFVRTKLAGAFFAKKEVIIRRRRHGPFIYNNNDSTYPTILIIMTNARDGLVLTTTHSILVFPFLSKLEIYRK